jgi:hypothetical protein
VHVDGDGDAAAASTQGLCDRMFGKKPKKWWDGRKKEKTFAP